MLNKTDTAETGNTKNKASIQESSSITDNKSGNIGNFQIKTTVNNLIKYLQPWKLRKKAVIFSLAIGILPVLGISMIAYSVGSQSIRNQIIKTQENKAISLGDMINSFMLSRYGDIQILANLPFLTNTQIAESMKTAEKQAVLNGFIAAYQGYDHVAVFDLKGEIFLQSQGGISNQEKELKYFQQVLEQNAPVISQPETLKNQAVVIYIAAPVKDIVTGETIALVRTRIPINRLIKSLKNSLNQNYDHYLVDSQGKFFFSPQKDLLGQSPTVIYPDLANLLKPTNLDISTAVKTIEQTPQLVTYAPLKKVESLPNLSWQLILAQDAEIVIDSQIKLMHLLTKITVLIGVLMTLLVAWFSKSMIKPNNSDQINIPVSHDKEQKLSVAIKEKDIQIPQSSISEQEQEQKDRLNSQILQLITQGENAVAGDLTVNLDVKEGEIGTIANILNSILENFRNIVIQLQQNVSQINQDISGNQDAINYLGESAITEIAEIQSSLVKIEDMTNAMQTLTDSTKEISAIANHVNYTADKSEKAMDLTVKNILFLQETVDETAQKVRYLGESSQQISRVVSLINQIAVQTNLLAINASIEVARAGEEGQGFAVVAEEVGELAARSATATQEIEQIAEKIKRDTTEVMKAIEIGVNQVIESTQNAVDAKESLNGIGDICQQIDNFVESISTTATSQLETSQIISQVIENLAAISQKTSDSSRQISTSLQRTTAVCQQLEKQVETFKVT